VLSTPLELPAVLPTFLTRISRHTLYILDISKQVFYSACTRPFPFWCNVDFQTTGGTSNHIREITHACTSSRCLSAYHHIYSHTKVGPTSDAE